MQIRNQLFNLNINKESQQKKEKIIFITYLL